MKVTVTFPQLSLAVTKLISSTGTSPIHSTVTGAGQVIAGALPLLYDMGERIVVGATFDHDTAVERAPAVPSAGTRRSRLLEGVGYEPSE